MATRYTSCNGAPFTTDEGNKNYGGVWIPFFHHSISVTHNLSLKIPYPFGTITHLSSLNIFHTVYGPHTCHSVHFFFFLLKKKNKKKRGKPILEGRRRSHLVWKEKEKKEDKETHALNPMKKKRKKDGQKLRLKSNNGSLHVVLFTEMLLSYELWKLKTAKMCFQFP